MAKQKFTNLELIKIFVVSLLLMAIMWHLTGCGYGEFHARGTKDITGPLEAEISLLRQDLASQDSELTALQATILQLVEQEQQQVIDAADAHNSIVALTGLVSAIQAQQVQQQAQISNMLLQLATLNGYTNITGIINPCGQQGAYDEVLLRLSDGRILASFSDNIEGRNTRFSIIPPGSYIDTDGSNCHFTVHTDGTVTW